MPKITKRHYGAHPDVKDAEVLLAVPGQLVNDDQYAAIEKATTRTVEPDEDPVEPEGDAGGNDGGNGDVEPTRPAQKATKAEWEAFAATLEVDVEGLSKDDIIAAVDVALEED